MVTHDLTTYTKYLDDPEQEMTTKILSSPAYIQTYIDKQKISKMLRIDIDGETIEVSIKDLYAWRLNKIRRGGYHTKINGTDYLFMAAKTDLGAAGFIFFKQSDVVQGAASSRCIRY